jgi:hypothetical protein
MFEYFQLWCILFFWWGLKWDRKYMPKFYRGERSGLVYRVRGVGWLRRIPLLKLFPYLTGDTIAIHLAIKPVIGDQMWEKGILIIDPSKDYLVFPFRYQDNSTEVLSDCYFSKNKWWSKTLYLKGGTSFSQPEPNITYSLILANPKRNDIDPLYSTSLGNLQNKHLYESIVIKLADIQIVERDTFLMWCSTTIFTLIAAIASVIAAIIGFIGLFR